MASAGLGVMAWRCCVLRLGVLLMLRDSFVGDSGSRVWVGFQLGI